MDEDKKNCVILDKQTLQHKFETEIKLKGQASKYAQNHCLRLVRSHQVFTSTIYVL